jgi:hypothetical protein
LEGNEDKVNPEGGSGGGNILFSAHPKVCVTKVKESFTGFAKFLKKEMGINFLDQAWDWFIKLIRCYCDFAMQVSLLILPPKQFLKILSLGYMLPLLIKANSRSGCLYYSA